MIIGSQSEKDSDKWSNVAISIFFLVFIYLVWYGRFNIWMRYIPTIYFGLQILTMCVGLIGKDSKSWERILSTVGSMYGIATIWWLWRL